MIETHAHLHHFRFDGVREELLEQISAAGVEKLVNLPVSMEENFAMRRMLAGTPWISFAAGVHPNAIGPEDDPEGSGWLEQLRALAQDARTAAIGEVGLDYHRPGTEHLWENQRRWFHRFLELSRETKLPLVLHIRQAGRDGLEILKAHGAGYCGIVHCFDGGYDLARAYLDLGFYLGIGGKVTYTRCPELREAVGKIGPGHIVLETDSPFLVPDGCPGTVNSPLNLPRIARETAALQGVSYDAVITKTTENARRVFRF